MTICVISCIYCVGEAADLFTGVLFNGYGPPAGFSWDQFDTTDPIMVRIIFMPNCCLILEFPSCICIVAQNDMQYMHLTSQKKKILSTLLAKAKTM